MPFNEILARERKARGLSQEDLAARIQVSRQAVSKWETGDAMPDLNKLLALADALEISLDTLCGREGQPSAVPVAEGPAPLKKRPILLPFLCALLVGCLLAGGLWTWRRQNIVPSQEAPAASALAALPDDFTVSGVSFHGQSDYRVAYQFTPSVSGEPYTYQITFTDSDGGSFTFDAPYSGGVCTGTAALSGGWIGYSVTVSVSDGVNSRKLAVANGLGFSEGSSHWTPLVD